MTKTGILIGFVASLLFVSLIAYSFPAFAQGSDSAPGKPDVIAVSGIVPGKNLIVHIWVVVPPGADRNEAAAAALANQGARPFTADEYTTIALFWDQFSDSDPGNDFVTQNYNPKNDPTNGGGLTALLNTHNSWTGVATSGFTFEYGGETGRCPSLVQECRGPQKFDGNNDVAWVALRDANTLGVTWSGTSTDEADMALNTNFNWTTDGISLPPIYDIETVFLHENGHVAGLGHSADTIAIMFPSYQKPNHILYQDDKDGISFLYPPVTNDAAPTVSISSPISTAFTLTDSITFTATATDPEDSDITSSIMWTSNKDGQIGTGGSFTTDTLSNNIHEITATVTDSAENTSSDSITITVGTITTSTSSSVQPIGYQLAGGKSGDKHLLITIHVVDDLGDNVSGADVSISISSDSSRKGWGGSAPTGTDGTVTFQLSNAKSGCYSTVVNSVASDPAWDGIQPTDSGFCKSAQNVK